MSRGEVIGLLGGTFNEEDKVLKVGKGVRSTSVEDEDRHFLFTTYSVVKFVFSDSRSCVCADLCGGAMQQCEHRFAVRDGPSVSDTGL